MLRFVGLSLFFGSLLLSFGGADLARAEGKSCKALPLHEADIRGMQKRSQKEVGEILADPSFQDFMEEAKKKGEFLQQTEGFQRFVERVEEKLPQSLLGEIQDGEGDLFVFVSFSMGEKALLGVCREAKRYGATVVLRGFLGGSFKRTTLALAKIMEETGEGMIVDPHLFQLFRVQSVPTFVLSEAISIVFSERRMTPVFDQMVGMMSLRYALERFATEGDLSTTAKAVLRKGTRT